MQTFLVLFILIVCINLLIKQLLKSVVLEKSDFDCAILLSYST